MTSQGTDDMTTTTAPAALATFRPATFRKVALPVLSAAARRSIEADPLDRFREWLDRCGPGGRQPSKHTRRAYTAAVRAFGSWLTDETDADQQAAAAVAAVLAHDGAAMQRLLEDWRGDLLASGLSCGTAICRLTGVLSLIGHARRCGLVGYRPSKVLAPVERREDRSGPSRDAVAELLAGCGEDAEGLRDAAAIRLAHNVGLRRAEIVGLTVADVTLDHAEGATVAVLGKGRTERAPVRLDPSTAASLRRWLEVRGTEPGPLLVRLDRSRASDLEPMGGEALRRMLARRAARAGIRSPVRPHGLRHRGATEVAASVGSIAALQAWGRWSSLESARSYLDDARRAQLGAAVAIAL
jgi:integrase